MDIDAYLHRIGAARPAGTSAADLAALHEAHIRTVPFENYDIHLGVPISLRLDDLHDKIVRRGRGGFCYELNGIFAGLLRELGFGVTLLSAFQLSEDGVRGPEFDHLRLIVETSNGEWLADVGNGARWLRPISLRPGVHGGLRPGVHGGIRVHRDGDLWWADEQRPDGEWERGWAWTPQPRELTDFTDRCRFQEHDPESVFRQRRLAVLATARGRISMVNGVFSEIVDGVGTERDLTAEQEHALLAQRFGIVLDAAPVAVG